MQPLPRIMEMSINQSSHGLLSVWHETEENANSPTLPCALAEKLPETIVRAWFHQIGYASHTVNTYFLIFVLFFNSLHIYTRGILWCLVGFWSALGQNPARAIEHMLSFSLSVFLPFLIFFLLVILNLCNPGELTQSESGIELTVLKPCGCSSLTQAFSVNAFRCRIRGELAGNSFARTTCPETHWPHRIVRPRG